MKRINELIFLSDDEAPCMAALIPMFSALQILDCGNHCTDADTIGAWTALAAKPSKLRSCRIRLHRSCLPSPTQSTCMSYISRCTYTTLTMKRLLDVS
jgi:hypothetical protein